jgi:hypothetical protein
MKSTARPAGGGRREESCVAVSEVRRRSWSRRLVLLDLVGLMLFWLGFNPGSFGLDRSRVIGYVQALVFLIGLGLIVLTSYRAAALQRRNGDALSLIQDIGGRLMATGYVLAAFSSVADLVGLGSEPLPRPPHFGVLQIGGLLLGVLLTLIGLLMMYPRRRPPPSPDAPTQPIR